MKKNLKKLTLSKETIQKLSRTGLQGVAAGDRTNSEHPESYCQGESGCGVICNWESVNYSCESVDVICE